METQVLEQYDLATRGLVDNLLRLGADTLVGKDDALAKQLLQLGHNGLQAVLGGGLAVGTPQVGHEDDGFSALVNGIFDSGQGSDDPLVVGDVLFGVEGDVKVDLSIHVSIHMQLQSRRNHTRMRTRLSLRSTSVMDSLLDRDMADWFCAAMFSLAISRAMDTNVDMMGKGRAARGYNGDDEGKGDKEEDMHPRGSHQRGNKQTYRERFG